MNLYKIIRLFLWMSVLTGCKPEADSEKEQEQEKPKKPPLLMEFEVITLSRAQYLQRLEKAFARFAMEVPQDYREKKRSTYQELRITNGHPHPIYFKVAPPMKLPFQPSFVLQEKDERGMPRKTGLIIDDFRFPFGYFQIYLKPGETDTLDFPHPPWVPKANGEKEYIDTMYVWFKYREVIPRANEDTLKKTRGVVLGFKYRYSDDVDNPALRVVSTEREDYWY